MKIKSLLAAFLAIGLLAGLAYVGQQASSPADKMAVAAQKLLDSLNDEQKAKATFAFDSKERTNWNFVPLQDKNRNTTRKGIGLYELDEKQKKIVLELLAGGTSETGKKKAVTIMTLESILNTLEKNGGSVRNPEWYFVTIFGTPSKTGKWGWRLEGHHLSLNYTMDGGQVVSATPAFFGSNPAIVVKAGKIGMETLPDCENLSRELFLSLDEDQKKVALQAKPFPEPEQKSVAFKEVPPVGISVAKLNEKQKKLLRRLVESYANRMPPAVAEVELKQIRQAGFEKIHFAYTGSGKPREPHTYRVQGPTFVIEFLNAQADSVGTPANHIHSAWRKIGGDFGI